jgi:hypothetical protein
MRMVNNRHHDDGKKTAHALVRYCHLDEGTSGK